MQSFSQLSRGRADVICGLNLIYYWNQPLTIVSPVLNIQTMLNIHLFCCTVQSLSARLSTGTALPQLARRGCLSCNNRNMFEIQAGLSSVTVKI